MSLLKAGGIAGLAIGVVYAIYREIIKARVVPRLAPWQGFALLCLLAILVFAIAMYAISRQGSQGAPPKLQGELPPDNHFELDALNGPFCEATNVRDIALSWFDMVDIGLSQCPGGSEGQRSYRLEWPSHSLADVVPPAARRNYKACFANDFSSLAPKAVEGIRSRLTANAARVPCKVMVAASRVINITYDDLHNKPIRVGFAQFYRDGNYSITQLPVNAMTKSDDVESIGITLAGDISDDTVLSIAKEYRFPGVPGQ